MPTTQVGPGSSLELQDIADTLGRARKVVVITGAGISTNCGIPVSGGQTARRRALLTRNQRTFVRKMACTH
jgi:hypothetical protein